MNSNIEPRGRLLHLAVLAALAGAVLPHAAGATALTWNCANSYGDYAGCWNPAAAWLFGSGLLGLIGVARRNRRRLG